MVLHFKFKGADVIHKCQWLKKPDKLKRRVFRSKQLRLAGTTHYSLYQHNPAFCLFSVSMLSDASQLIVVYLAAPTLEWYQSCHLSLGKEAMFPKIFYYSCTVSVSSQYLVSKCWAFPTHSLVLLMQSHYCQLRLLHLKQSSSSDGKKNQFHLALFYFICM